MRTEIIAIGEELLQGKVINSNAAYLSRELWKKGYPVASHHVIKDAKESAREIKEILQRADLTLITGGLGPTLDDLTREILCDLFQTELELNQELYEDLKKRYPHVIDAEIEGAAMQPKTAKLLPNRLGSAPALLFEKEQKVLCAMPGVPQEMVEICEKEFFPWLEKSFPSPFEKFSFSYFLSLQIEPEVDLILREIAKENPAIQIGIYPDIPNLEIVFSVDASSKKEAKKKIEAAEKKLYEKLSFSIYSLEDRRIEKALHDYFLLKKEKIAFAESCTGGALAKRFTAIPDCSKYFLGSFVTYDNQLKEDILGIDPTLIKRHGVVSKEVVCEMAKGVLNHTQADIVLATSGIAGPSGGSREKPVGTVYLAIGERGKEPVAGKIHSRGDREFVIAYTSTYLLSSLWQWLVHNIKPKFQ